METDHVDQPTATEEDHSSQYSRLSYALSVQPNGRIDIVEQPHEHNHITVLEEKEPASQPSVTPTVSSTTPPATPPANDRLTYNSSSQRMHMKMGPLKKWVVNVDSRLRNVASATSNIYHKSVDTTAHILHTTVSTTVNATKAMVDSTVTATKTVVDSTVKGLHTSRSFYDESMKGALAVADITKVATNKTLDASVVAANKTAEVTNKAVGATEKVMPKTVQATKAAASKVSNSTKSAIDASLHAVERGVVRAASSLGIHKQEVEEYNPILPDDFGYSSVPPMNIVIHIVGSRGDVQPFIALGKELQKYGHRVRLATHATFRKFVTENGLEFYPLAGNPEELMAYMVKNPGLIPGVESLRAGDVGKKRVMIKEILDSTYESCILPDPEDPAKRPFLCDAIISNPPAFGHIHCAQRLQVPLHIFFTMPWSQTHAFPHPLTNMSYSNTPRHQMNYLSYDIVELLTWEGLGDIINNFRAGLLLPKLSTAAAVPYLRHLHVPHSYLWSQSLIAKPEDWGSWIDVVGFVFLDLASSYTPPQDLVDFLNAGEKPVYIGFGSIVVDDPDAMTKLVFDAVKESGVRAIVSKGWGGIGGGDLKVPENVYLIGNCPHDWLFLQVAGVVHHGGAGTTAAGLKAGKPTFIVPFFGDQPFWGSMVATVNAGPAPIPYKDLNVENFAASIKHLLQSEVIEAAQKVSVHMNQENGAIAGARSFHRFIFEKVHFCEVYPKLLAHYLVLSTGQRLSERAVDEWTKDGLIKRSDLVKISGKEWDVDFGAVGVGLEGLRLV